MVKINIKIRNFRKKAGITQTALAEAVGVNQSMIAHYESGFKMPSVPVLARIAKELNCKIDDLI
jgi:transcriptional regulator with XRE-family HTH domain